MELKSILSVISGVLFVAGFVPYIIAILRGETKPAKASWIIWASLDYIVLAGMIAEKTVNGQILGAVIGATIVIGLAMKYGASGWTRTDKFCLIGAMLGISLWMIFKNPTFGIMTSCIVAFIGSFPTFISAWKDPSKENRLAWTIFWISCVCAMIAIPRMTFADAAQPTTFFLIESVMMYILYFRAR
ncbi:MAG: hypothetical protein UR69_C0002G0235 [Candidatus Moranbacteria bacterium GW2011_GWE2_35_2-]|nr:MAG: hypothetical protein UR69_C0002G0235 [Candidatus Moranbacteria bacterium GW2011_GWE2_35_2-]KKQ22417.1 MAG: hypothetical protein US37_C0002G0042 [Candidatus Moranbacteria bacterium GW2011_GWF2_37_11]KKQ29486.1 MAG: hypothetical protein US44_C0001G0078 [Candidatus Moranbacteria bacterium GW2011_GWD1_37_17]KKQ30645.1 MAG: hypothetical protein US47_C0002G0235 [Candidatus Moranbacteria bacterium GW2011_GWE1_37_24]KKQ47747.1 MAG: hypothetical protein US66_C0006G0006 [Candidatus Moranbacteria 